MRPRIEIGKNVFVDMIEKGCTRAEMTKILKVSKSTLARLLNQHDLSTKKEYEDLVGKQFEKLKVIKRLENSSDRRRVYLCQCECGNFTKVKARYLNCGDTRSCGCYKDFGEYKEQNQKEAYKKVGEKHGKLTIIDIKKDKHVNVYNMVCECECGNIVERKYSNILKIQTPSCGCYAKEMSSKRMSEDILVKFKNNRNKNWYFIKNDEIVYCRSGYEVIYANYLILNNIEFEYEPECFKLDNGKRYTPDFYLINEDKYIEIKGVPFHVFDESSQSDKIKIFRKKYGLDIYYWDDLVNICHLPYKGYANYGARAIKLNVSSEDYLGKYLYLTY